MRDLLDVRCTNAGSSANAPLSEVSALNLTREAMDAALEGLTDFEALRGPARKTFRMDLTEIQRLIDGLGLRSFSIPVIQIVGSKGKGSVALLCETLLRHHGLKTGLYQSPHLLCRDERILIEGRPASEASRLAVGQRLLPLLDEERTTRFEAETALAFGIFEYEDVDLAIVEAGVGGISDATSVIGADILICTSVELEHTALLGSTLASIARQKVAVLRTGIPLILGPLPEEAMTVVWSLARERMASVVEIGVDLAIERVTYTPEGSHFTLVWGGRGQREERDLFLPLWGPHQPVMAAVAIAAANRFCTLFLQEELSEASWESLQTAFLPGRLQRLRSSPCLVVDTAHTVRSVSAALEACLLHRRRWPDRVLLALNEDKDIPALLNLLQGKTKRLLLIPNPSPRSSSPERLRDLFSLGGRQDAEVFPSWEIGWQCLQAGLAPHEIALALGSFSLAGAILRSLPSPAQR